MVGKKGEKKNIFCEATLIVRDSDSAAGTDFNVTESSGPRFFWFILSNGNSQSYDLFIYFLSGLPEFLIFSDWLQNFELHVINYYPKQAHVRALRCVCACESRPILANRSLLHAEIGTS